ncbi:unnamed protein product [Prorocentrum cordatum]|uniref:Uncharacterized protein n=1 Tax=Prorocentrum cordatum TaxID=2364126 RepID=A0ABN9PWS7_9DINO|nr:unnamed protein product [Polarella glacialis]
MCGFQLPAAMPPLKPGAPGAPAVGLARRRSSQTLPCLPALSERPAPRAHAPGPRGALAAVAADAARPCGTQASSGAGEEPQIFLFDEDDSAVPWGLGDCSGGELKEADGPAVALADLFCLGA